MKKLMLILILLLAIIFINGCTIEQDKITFDNLVGTPTDYSKGENWMVNQHNGDNSVDVFYLYPTSVSINDSNYVSNIDQYMKSAAYLAYERGPACLDEFTNIYAPYYRQLSYTAILSINTFEQLSQADYNSEVRTDVYAALDYFFEHYNNNKPFILASHSQGTAVMQFVLSEYMKAHPDYLKRMVAAYTIGGCYTEAYKEANPHLKFVTGETDTGVIISWNTEAPGATLSSIVLCSDNVCLINPLNWKTDSTYAGIEENKGSWDYNKHVEISGVADAQLDLNRKCIVTTTPSNYGYNYLPVTLFGDKSYHFDEWNFYYKNIQENAKLRIMEYFKNEKK